MVSDFILFNRHDSQTPEVQLATIYFPGWGIRVTIPNSVKKLLLRNFLGNKKYTVVSYRDLLLDMVSINLEAALIPSGVQSIVTFRLAFWFYD